MNDRTIVLKVTYPIAYFDEVGVLSAVRNTLGPRCTVEHFAPSAPGTERTAPVSRAHPDTAKQAARRIAPRAGAETRLILERLIQRGSMTAAEVAQWLGIARNQAAARLWELRKGGWVEWEADTDGVPVTRATDEAGRYEGRVQRATAQAHAWYPTRGDLT